MVVLLAILEVTRLHKQGFIPVSGLGIGFLFPIATTALIMIFHGNFKDFIWIQFSFLSKYPAIHIYGASYIESIIRGVFLLLLTSTTIGWISIYCLYGLIVGRSRSNSVQMYVIVMWWIAGVVHLVVQNKFYGYHLLPILAPLALMTSQFVFEAIQSSQQFRMFISTLGLLLVAIPYATSDLPGKFVPFLNVSFGKVSIKSVYREDLFGVYNNGSDFSPRAEMEVAENITAHTKLNENVFIWGFEPGVYFLRNVRIPRGSFTIFHYMVRMQTTNCVKNSFMIFKHKNLFTF